MKTINLKAIRIDGGTQARISINNELVAEYAQAMKDGVVFPQIEVYFDGADHWLVDGFHRLHAMLACGKASATVTVFNGTLREAVYHSLAVNNDHGLRKSNEDKRKSVQTMLDDAEWVQISDHKIAKHCGCSHMLVGRMRAPEKAEKQPETGTSSKKQPASTGTSSKTDDSQAAEIGTSSSPEDEYTPLDAAQDQIHELQSMLAVANMGDVDSEDKDQAKNLIAELRLEIKNLTALNRALTISRDGFQNQVAELQKQINRQRREIDRALGTKTA